MDIHNEKTWPPGALMKLDNRGGFIAFGLVVWNFEGQIGVVWPEKCWDRFCVYPISDLNPVGISRVE